MKKIFKIISTFIKVRYFSKWTSRDKLLEYQKKQVEKHLKFLKENSPYFEKHEITKDFTMNKTFMMTNFDELNTLGVKKDEAMDVALNSEKTRNFNQKYKNISVGLSSGTSGHRGMFITTPEEQGIWAGTILAKMLPKNNIFGHKIAFFLRADNDLYKTINSFLISLEYFDTFKNIDEHIERLNKYKPSMIVAPPSLLLILAKNIEEGKLNISPKRVISVAEILEKADEEYIKKQFKLNIIHQIYQATEGFLACTCEYGHLHLNEDLIKFEKKYIDEKRFYPIITDFRRTSQPFINYYLNDILVESTEPCECGSILQRIEKIEGRSDDIFKFVNKFGKEIVVFPDFIRRTILFVENIREYQVFQINSSLLEIAILNINEEQKELIRKEFNKLFSSLEIENIEIKFIDYSIDRTKKLKRVVRKVVE
ncbi:F390 synthetase-related protein [Fusobacterium hwasookii]|uniref:F390 synthetase-related protein n=1 Tax=Fusobacterium hwasookii TaxID=1583098 RepID=UPI0028EEBC55|nr:F390 synthetase-related protein [Fusobacterium hwasookii]